VFPSLNTRALPRNEPIVIEFPPAKSGDIAFAWRDEHAARHYRRSKQKVFSCHSCQEAEPKGYYPRMTDQRIQETPLFQKLLADALPLKRT